MDYIVAAVVADAVYCRSGAAGRDENGSHPPARAFAIQPSAAGGSQDPPALHHSVSGRLVYAGAPGMVVQLRRYASPNPPGRANGTRSIRL